MPGFNQADTFNLLSKLTPRRAWNGIKVLSSYYLSKWTKKPVQWGYPISISFEPTTSCNLRCPECPSGLRAFTRPTGMLKKDFFSDTIDQLHKELLYLVFYFQGEPYLNPDFLDMVKYASGKKIYTATSTNAHYLTDAKCAIRANLSPKLLRKDEDTNSLGPFHSLAVNVNRFRITCVENRARRDVLVVPLRPTEFAVLADLDTRRDHGADA